MYKRLFRILSNQTGKVAPAMLGGVAVVIAASGFGFYQYASHNVPISSAAGDIQLCASQGSASACLNAWSGGPWVKVYSDRGTTHNNFTLGFDSTLQVWYIKYSGGGNWNNKCIGDAYNDPQNPLASLDSCPSGSNSGGWGTHFNESPCDGGAGVAFYDIREKGYLSPALYGSGANGANFILDGGTPVACYHIYPPA
jgi:hypothetical protein